MRKVVFLLGVLWLGLSARGQMYLNGITVNGTNQYMQLYNAGITPVGVNLNCYTLITYFKSKAEEGFYVLTLPQFQVPAQRPVFMAGSNNITYPDGSVYRTDVNWNSVVSGTTFKKYLLRKDGSKADYSIEAVPAGFDQLFARNADAYMVFLFNGTSMADAFISGRQRDGIPDYLKQLPDLSFSNGCGNVVDINFHSLYTMYPGVFARAVLLRGNEFGFYRTGTGECGGWNAAMTENDLMPGFRQAAYNNNSFQLATAFSCERGTLSYILNRGSAAPASFTIRLFIDNPPYGVLSPNDVEFSGSPVNYTNTGASVRGYFTGIPSNYAIVVVDAPGVCYDIVRPVDCSSGETPLSTSLQAFDIHRNNAAAQIAWQTITDQNQRSMELQRKTGADQWTTIAYVAALAPETGSNRTRHYLYEDMFPFGDQVEYRLKEVDVTGRSAYSEIRSLPGEPGYDGLVVYPNPSSDGRVNVHFDDINSPREVQLVSMSGSVVRQWRSINNREMQINNLYPGNYVLRVIDQQSGMVSTKKVIVAQ